MMIGTFVGGATIYKLGINRSLWVFGFIQLLSILGFAVLAEVGDNVTVLSLFIAFEYLGVGLGTAALVAFMSRNTSKISQQRFALFSSLIALPRTFANAVTGLVEGVGKNDGISTSFLVWQGLGYTNFFLVCTAFAVPGMILLIWVAPWTERHD